MTLTVQQLIGALTKLPPDMPVVVTQEDEPLGNYGVTGVSQQAMHRDESWSYRDVWDWDAGSRSGPKTPVAYLETDEPVRPVVDAEVEPPALPAPEQPPAEVAAPSAGELAPTPQPTRRIAYSELDAAEYRAMGWIEAGETDDGATVFLRPMPAVEAQLPIDDYVIGLLADGEHLAIRGGAANHMRAYLTAEVTCTNCGKGPRRGENWTATLAADDDGGSWRHSEVCP
jgi:hypothetical protein